MKMEMGVGIVNEVVFLMDMITDALGKRIKKRE